MLNRDIPSSNFELREFISSKPVLTESQDRLCQLLFEKNQLLSNMYKGSLLILSQLDNPDHLALAAHGMRELMEKFPIIADVPVESANNNMLRDIVNKIIWEFKKMVSRSDCYRNGEWEGTIDGHLNRFLSVLNNDLTQNDTLTSPRRDQGRKMIRSLTDTKYPTAEAIEQHILTRWKELRGYFTGVAHHSTQTTYEEMIEKLQRLNQLIFELLRPKIAESLNELDRLIQEAEA
jgi:hypothetical protein